MLNNHGKSVHPCLIPHLRGNAFTFSLLRAMLAMALSYTSFIMLGSLVAQTVKPLPTMWETSVRSLGQEDPLEKEMQPTPVLLPGKSHGWRSLVGYSPWGRKELDTTE